MDILLKLLLVHFVADFFLQWPKMLQSKADKKFLSPYLYLHGVIHGALSLLVLFDLSWALPIAGVFISHIILDGLKCTFTSESNKRLLFFIDQLLHVVIIVAVWFYKTGAVFDLQSVIPHFWAHALCLFFISYPASIFIQNVFSKWTLPSNADESLAGVGAYIGFIERILVYVAVVTNNWGLVGFIIAAKSIFRFGEFNKNDQRMYAEYLFVGTLLSLFIAIMAGLFFLVVSGQGLHA